MCNFLHQEGWKAISILINSGASDSVAPKGFFPEIPTYETNASRANLMYPAAGGNNIRNEGMCITKLYSLDGRATAFAFQVAGVSKALGAVSRIVGAGNRVVFDNPAKEGSYIENKTTGVRTPSRQHNGVYYLDMWMKPGEHIDVKGFQRQGA